MVIYLSVFVALFGLLVYSLSTAPKPAEVGRLLFFAGLLAFLLRVEELLRLLPR